MFLISVPRFCHGLGGVCFLICGRELASRLPTCTSAFRPEAFLDVRGQAVQGKTQSLQSERRSGKASDLGNCGSDSSRNLQKAGIQFLQHAAGRLSSLARCSSETVIRSTLMKKRSSEHTRLGDCGTLQLHAIAQGARDWLLATKEMDCLWKKYDCSMVCWGIKMFRGVC